MKLNLAWLVAGATAVVAACAATEATAPSWDEDGGVSTEVPGTDASVEPTPDGGSPSEQTVCGDGKLEPGEPCDDGNNADGDGCSATCKTESAGPNDVCPGVAIALTLTGADLRQGSVSGTTESIFGQTGASCGGASGKDAVYSVTSDVTGLLTAKLTSTFDSVLYARRTCDDTKTEAACNDAPGSAGGETIRLPVTKDQPVFLFIDGYAGSTGSFTLDVEVATAFCGNGIAESPEACDDGNAVAGDGCAPDCTLEAGGILTACPGQGVSLTGVGTAPRKISFAGSTSIATSSTHSAVGCDGRGRNTVYSITPDVSGSMKAKLLATYNKATLHVRSECDIQSSQMSCAASTDALENIELDVPVRAGFPTYVFVDSSDTAAHGPYTLDVVVTPGVCGNGILDGTEECDDGNAQSGDGCTAECKLEPVPSEANNCPGVPLQLAAGPAGSYTGVFTSSTSPMANSFKPKKAQGGCSAVASNTAKDAVFTITSPIDGYATATVSGTFGTILLARDGCDADAAAYEDLACSDSVKGNGPETISFPVHANARVYLIVDGESANSEGLFELGVTVTPSVCGNDVIEGGEQCDDANTANGDGCSSTCQLEPVTGNDTCSDGLANPIQLTPQPNGSHTATITSGTTNLANNQAFGLCSSSGPDAIYTVKAPMDSVLSLEVPVAGFNVTLGVRTSCPASSSANNTDVRGCANATSEDGGESLAVGVEKDKLYYIFVDGAASNEKGAFTLHVDVRASGCGDNLLSGNEQCDDGNNVSGDGCSPTCTLEALAGIDTCPGFTLPLSGNGNGPWTGVLSLDTSTLNANYSGTCGGTSKDGVVVVTPPISGKLTAKFTGFTYQPVLYARTTCNDASTEPLLSTGTTTRACDDDALTWLSNFRDIQFKVTAGTPYYLFLDGYEFQSGVGRLNVTVTP